MNIKIDRNRFWWGMAGLIVLVLGGVNIFLYSLRKSITQFIADEMKLDAGRIGQIHEFRQYKEDHPKNLQPKFDSVAP